MSCETTQQGKRVNEADNGNEEKDRESKSWYHFFMNNGDMRIRLQRFLKMCSVCINIASKIPNRFRVY